MPGSCNSCCRYIVYLISRHVPIYVDTYMKGIALMIKDISHTMSCIVWACHLYPVAVGVLPVAWGVTNREFQLLVLLQFPLI